MSSHRPRVILLGASNLTLGLPAVIGHVRRVLGPASFYIACGHGRSYGVRTRIFGRALPGIVPCGLWDALNESHPAPTYALLTDIGNDIGYGFPADRIVEWIDSCAQRLAAHDARLLVTDIPQDTIARLPAWRFRLLRTVMFLGNRASLEQVVDTVQTIRHGLHRIAEHAGGRIIDVHPHWYGWDAIHIRRCQRRAVWANLLQPWSDHPVKTTPAVPLIERFAIHRLHPECWQLLGMQRRQQQPALRLRDGSTLHAY